MRWRQILVGALLCLTPLGARAEGDDPLREAVAVVLAAGESDASGAPSEERLQALGPAAVPALVDAFAKLRPDSPAGEAVAAAIRGHGFPTLERALRSALAGEDDRRARLRALRLLGRLAGPEGIPLAVEIVGSMEPERVAAGRVDGPWQVALRGMLASDAPRSALYWALRDLPPALLAPTGRVLAETGRPGAVGALFDLLEARPQEPVGLLLSLSRAPPLALARLEAFTVEETLRHYLMKGEEPVRAAAAAAASRLGVHPLVPDLMDLLSSKDPASRRAAQAALHSLTGTTAGSRPEAWQTWLDGEERWAERSDLAARLDAGDPATLLRALRDASAHPYAAAAELQAVTRLARHVTPGVRLGAVAALRAFGYAGAAQALVPLLDDEEPAVRKAAHLTLLKLTGERLEPDADAWRRLLVDPG